MLLKLLFIDIHLIETTNIVTESIITIVIKYEW